MPQSQQSVGEPEREAWFRQVPGCTEISVCGPPRPRPCCTRAGSPTGVVLLTGFQSGQARQGIGSRGGRNAVCHASYVAWHSRRPEGMVPTD